MKVQTSVSRIVNREWILDDDIRKFMEKRNQLSLTYDRKEILEINEEDIVNSYLNKRGHSINDEAGYWYANQLYDMVHDHTELMFGDKEDMCFEIIEPGYPCDIPWSDRVFENVEEFHKWMIEEGEKERLEDEYCSLVVSRKLKGVDTI